MLLIIHDLIDLSIPVTQSQNLTKQRIKTLWRWTCSGLLPELCELFVSLALLPVLGKMAVTYPGNSASVCNSKARDQDPNDGNSVPLQTYNPCEMGGGKVSASRPSGQCRYALQLSGLTNSNT